MQPLLHVPGSPAAEHRRSLAAQRVARLARKSDLFFSHFEHRARLAPPASWLPAGREEPAPTFQGGVLAESKYQAFRHDLLIASFHPGHRAQWTAHELCHALVGFAYRPGGSLLFHALAAWLAELLPVTLWYFLDEADVRKCPRHEGQGPLFQTFCEACEQAALAGPRKPDARAARCLREGRRFLEGELAAVARSRRRGVPEGTRFATIDLAQDALRYASNHGPRLRAPEMERFVAQFFAPRQGHHASLEALEARVREVFDDLVGERAAKPWRATRWDYAAQDVGYRLLTLRAQLDGALAEALDTLIDRLAAARSEAGITRVIEDYGVLLGDARARRRLPDAETLFAVGYALPGGLGSSVAQVRQGVASACPSAWAALGRKQSAVARAFCADDVPVRAPIGRRFARHLTERSPGPVADLARVEAAISHVAQRDLVSASLDPSEMRDDRLRLADGVEIVRIEHDVLSMEPSEVARAARGARALLIARAASDEVDVLELPIELAAHVEESRARPLRRAAFKLDDATLDALIEAAVLVPAAYRE